MSTKPDYPYTCGQCSTQTFYVTIQVLHRALRKDEQHIQVHCTNCGNKFELQ